MVLYPFHLFIQIRPKLSFKSKSCNFQLILVSSREVKCPKCHGPFQVPRRGVEDLPINYFTASAVSAANASAKVDPNNVRCELCEENEATVKCSNCTSSSARPARKCTKSRRCLPTTSTSRLTRPCREGPPHLPPGFFIVRSILNMRSTLTARLTRLRCVPSALLIPTRDMMLIPSPPSPRASRTPFPLW